MSSESSHNEFSHRQGSVTTLPDEDDQITTASDLPKTPQRQESFAQKRVSTSSSILSNGYSKIPDLDGSQSFNVEKEYQTASIDLETVPDNSDDNSVQNWKRLSQETSPDEPLFQGLSESPSADDVTTSFGFQQPETTENQHQLSRQSSEQIINPTTDYETLVRSKQLYFDPNPEFIRKPQMIAPIVYKQNIMVKFLKPPSVPQGPLIIREVRPPQPPPPPPLVVRQRPPPPLSPPPIVLREKPPRVPVLLTTQVLTKTLPPIPPPPRSVIIEKLPPLPPKPRDIIIERWIPYESTTHKRKVVVQRAEEPKPHPPPRNIIITYDKIEAKIVREFRRFGVTPEDPQSYSSRYGHSLLDTKDLLAQAKELGITEDISLPNVIEQELQEKLTSNLSHTSISNENLFQSKKFEKRSSNGSSSGSYKADIDNTYVPTFDNLLNELSSSINANEYTTNQQNLSEEISTQLAQYGLTMETIPY